MNINEIILQNENVMFVVSGKDLKDFANALVNRFVSCMEYEAPEASTDDKLYTADEVCDLLHITKPTLWRWDKADYLKPVRIGAKRFYSDADIKKLSNK